MAQVRSLNFIAGLPRAGSTLLAALLAQNPSIRAGITSPLCALVRACLPVLSRADNSALLDDARRDATLIGMAEGFLGDGHHVVDTSRAWLAHLGLIARLWPAARVICCVRHLGWILNSFERIYQRHPGRLSTLCGRKVTGSCYERADILTDPTNGVLGAPFAALREAFYGPHADRIVLVDYETLTASPRLTLARLYEICGWELYAHDVQNVEYSADAFDEAIGAPGLHSIRGPVRLPEGRLVIPPDLFDRYRDSAFWREPAVNHRGVEVLGPLLAPLREVA